MRSRTANYLQRTTKPRKDLTGNKYGRLKVIKQSEFDYVKPSGIRTPVWLCKCKCGNYIEVIQDSLKNGHTKSCGCLALETSSIIGKKSKGIKKKNNIYDLSGDYGIGYTVNNNKKFLFDLEDYEIIKKYTWSYHNGYIRTSIDNKDILLHRLVMNVNNPKVVVDHCGHVTTDNRKSKLRITTSNGNQKNKSLSKNNKSGVTGVCWDNDSNNWSAYIWTNGKTIHLGHYNNFDDAVKSRKEAENKHFGEFSYDNSMKLYKKEENVI